ncbi:PREDICTED: uncharacterized protein LOC109158437 [Ipomoea nil]|uniref:uncharacterized protein LOC109158437 n=1 Tax=Ipomoea nil TaxID=35883 RepID=UPI0009018A07|nr:PREDICTED: uncharacterized protein LOC109158437 [Ipomoea nil]
MEGASARPSSSRATASAVPPCSSPPQASSLPENNDFPKNVIIFMEALEKFTLEPLEWVLKNVVMKPCCTLSIIGIYPFLTFLESAKTSSEIWSVNCEDLQQGERRSDPKHLKVQFLMDLCQSYGVSCEIRTEMCHPVRSRIMEIITSLQATLVVFDKHHDRKNIEYYAEKVPYSIIIMNENGEVDMIKGRSQIDPISTAEESPHSLPPTPRVKISRKWKKVLCPIRRLKLGILQGC